VKDIVKRIRTAMRTNEPQATSVLMLTAITFGTALEAGGDVAIVAAAQENYHQTGREFCRCWPCAHGGGCKPEL